MQLTLLAFHSKTITSMQEYMHQIFYVIDIQKISISNRVAIKITSYNVTHPVNHQVTDNFK